MNMKRREFLCTTTIVLTSLGSGCLSFGPFGCDEKYESTLEVESAEISEEKKELVRPIRYAELSEGEKEIIKKAMRGEYRECRAQSKELASLFAKIRKNREEQQRSTPETDIPTVYLLYEGKYYKIQAKYQDEMISYY